MVIELIKIFNYDMEQLGTPTHQSDLNFALNRNFWAVSYNEDRHDFILSYNQFIGPEINEVVLRFDNRMISPDEECKMTYDGFRWNLDAKGIPNAIMLCNMIYNAIGMLLQRPEFAKVKQDILLKQIL